MFCTLVVCKEVPEELGHNVEIARSFQTKRLHESLLADSRMLKERQWPQASADNPGLCGTLGALQNLEGAHASD